MNTERFRTLTAVSGPFVSVYLDDARDTADAVTQLEAVWRDLQKHLHYNGADDDVVVALEDAILRGRAAVGRQGRAVIATHDRVLINEHLSSPPPTTMLRISDYPYLLPLVQLGRWRPTYVFASVDRAGADVTLHQRGIVSSETVDGGGYPVHKPATAGRSGYGDFQRTTDEAVRMNVRAVAQRLTELVDDSGAEAVFVCGEVRSRSNVVSALPDRVTALVAQLHAGARGGRVGEDRVGDLIEAEFERRHTAEMATIADRFRSEKGRSLGLAVEGLASVCAALRDGDVHTLIVDDLGEATVVVGQDRTTIAPDADVLSELGEAPRGVVRADEALPFTAVSVGADLVLADDRIAPADGIAALLRYAQSDLAEPDLASRQSVAN